MSDDDSGGCCGCITIILMGILLFGLIFGVTIGGQHYGISCMSCEEGIILDTNPTTAPEQEVIIVDITDEVGLVLEEETITAPRIKAVEPEKRTNLFRKAPGSRLNEVD